MPTFNAMTEKHLNWSNHILSKWLRQKASVAAVRMFNYYGSVSVNPERMYHLQSMGF